VSKFQDAIANALSFNHCHEGDSWKENDDAGAILDMPEMQAIRLCLFRMAIRLADDRYDGVVRDVFTNYGLSESVIEWMGAES